MKKSRNSSLSMRKPNAGKKWPLTWTSRKMLRQTLIKHNFSLPLSSNSSVKSKSHKWTSWYNFILIKDCWCSRWGQQAYRLNHERNVSQRLAKSALWVPTKVRVRLASRRLKAWRRSSFPVNVEINGRRPTRLPN